MARSADLAMTTLDEEARLTRRELESLRAYARYGSIRAASAALFVSESTTDNHLATAYAKLQVKGALGAFRVLGWLVVPVGEAHDLACSNDPCSCTPARLTA